MTDVTLLDRIYKAVFLFCLLLISCVQAAPIELTREEQIFIENNPVIKVGGELDWMPIDFVQDGLYSGLASDYLNLISEKTGLKFELTTGQTWQELLQLLDQGKIDLLPAIYWSPRRAETMHFTSPYIRLRHYAFARNSQRGISKIDDLFGRTVAVPRGYAFHELLTSEYPQIQVLLVDTTLEAIDAVITGQADAVIESSVLIGYFLRENNIHGLRPVFAADFGINEIHMAARSGMPQLASITDKVITNVTPDEHKALTERWLNITFPSGTAPELHHVIFDLEEELYLKQKGRLKTCIDPGWMPYEGFINGQHSGMTADYLRYFSDQIGIPIDVVKTSSWEESLEFVRKRHCDMLTLASNRPERREYLNFTKPYIHTSLALATRDNEWFYSDFRELKNKRIGIMRGYSPGKIIHKRYPDIKLIEFDSIGEGLKAVKQGQLLGFLEAVPTLSYHIQDQFLGDLKISGKFDYDWNVGVAARNDEPLLVQVLDKVILAMPESVHNRIRNNWLGVRYEQSIDHSFVWKLLGGFALILILIALRYRQVSRHRTEIEAKNVELARINTELEEQKETAQYMAHHDLLTGLPNRYQLLSRLEHGIDLAERQQTKIAVMFLDLDRFKYVNDSLGHHIGDNLLQQVGGRIDERLRSSDTLARIGGDEFVILLESFNDDEAPAILAQDIIDSIQQPFMVAEHSLKVSISIGIALYPEDGNDIHTLIKHADIAMYRAKELGRSRFRYYTQSLSERTEKRLRTESALREAMGQNQFSLHFQPIVDLQQRRVSHAEALIRWHHPEMGYISPEYFIPIAEENGLIHDLGAWVLREACRNFRLWQEQGLELCCVSINVSSIQFQRADFGRTFQAILDAEGVDARHVDIEITERYLMDQTERNIQYLNSLKGVGHTITVDDFGTGYSSMSYMKRLPLDVIKVDRSFISDIPYDKNDVQISQAIIALSHKLGYRVTAEGVENKEQLAFLLEAGCNYAQGYYFSRPLPAEQFIHSINQLNQQLATEDEALEV